MSRHLIAKRSLSSQLDGSCPINWTHYLNRSLIAEWTVPPLSGWRGGTKLRDLVHGSRIPHDGTLTSGPTWNNDSPTKLGGYGSLSYNGANYVSIGSIGFSRTAGQPCTLAAWARPTTDFSGHWGVLYNRNGAGAGQICKLEQDNNGHWAFEYDSTGSGGTAAGTIVNTKFTWYFIVGVYDGSNITLYVNGAQVAQVTGKPSAAISVDLWAIGREPDIAAEFFIGQIDGCLVWLRALSATEVTELYLQNRMGNVDRWRWASKTTWAKPAQAGAAANTSLLYNTRITRLLGVGAPVC